MIALVIVLLVTNLVTAVLLVRRGRPDPVYADADAVDVFDAPRPAGVTGRDRRLITLEVLNPLELASSARRTAGRSRRVTRARA